MPSSLYLECTFLIPIKRDSNLSDDEFHSADLWDWLINELFVQFGGGTESPGLCRGFYRDPDTGEQVFDESRKFTVAVVEPQVVDLRKLLSAACVLFQQKCVYLSVAGRVEFIHPPDP